MLRPIIKVSLPFSHMLELSRSRGSVGFNIVSKKLYALNTFETQKRFDMLVDSGINLLCGGLMEQVWNCYKDIKLYMEIV